MGSNFLTYNAAHNNCQVFILSVLKANNIGNQQDYDFVKQDTEELFNDLPNLRKLTNSITDLGGLANNLVYGDGLKIKKKALNNFEIENMCKTLKIPLVGVFMNDELPNHLIYGNFIVNLQNSNKSGSHWCSFILTKNNNCYFDPFGEIPSKETENYIKNIHAKVNYNNRDIQNFNSDMCGYFCIFYLYYMTYKYNKKKDFLTNVNDFINLFDKVNTKNNDMVLINYFKNI